MKDLRRSVPITIELPEQQIKEIEDVFSKTWLNNLSGLKLDIPELIELMLVSSIQQVKGKTEYEMYGYRFNQQMAASYIRKQCGGAYRLEDFMDYLLNHRIDDIVDFANTLEIVMGCKNSLRGECDIIAEGGLYSSLSGKVKYWYEFMDEDGKPVYDSYEDWKAPLENYIVQEREDALPHVKELQDYWMRFYEDDFYGTSVRKEISREEFAKRSPWIHTFDFVNDVEYHLGLDEDMDQEFGYLAKSKSGRSL